MFSFFFEPFFLNDPVIDLNREIVTLEDELEAHQNENTVIKQDFSKRLASLRSQLQVTKTALARSVPTVERFLRALQLGKAECVTHFGLVFVDCFEPNSVCLFLLSVPQENTLVQCKQMV